MQMLPVRFMTGEVPFGPGGGGAEEMAVRTAGPDQRSVPRSRGTKENNSVLPFLSDLKKKK